MSNSKNWPSRFATITTSLINFQNCVMPDYLKYKAEGRIGVRIIVFVLIAAAAILGYTKIYAQQATCNSSGPGAYTITLCISTPANGATLTGVVSVVPSITVVGTNPGIA